MVFPNVIHHFGGQAHKFAVDLESMKPNNEKLVSKKALSSTLNQPRIDYVYDKNMRKGCIKLFCTVYTLAIEPALLLNQFKALVKVQKEYGLRLIQGEY